METTSVHKFIATLIWNIILDVEAFCVLSMQTTLFRGSKLGVPGRRAARCSSPAGRQASQALALASPI